MSCLGINGEDTALWALAQSKSSLQHLELKTVAWIHSHVRGSFCGFSSVDVHTQHTSTKLTYENIIGIVVELSENDFCTKFDAYQLTPQGKNAVEVCRIQNTSIQHSECSDAKFFESVLSKVSFLPNEDIFISNFLASKLFQSHDNQRTKNTKNEKPEPDPEMKICKGCKKSFKAKSLNRHISLMKSCKAVYGDEFEEMKKQSRKQSIKTYNSVNKETIKRKQADYNEKNRETNKRKHARYNDINAESIKRKQAIYNAKNAEEIKRKQAEYNAIHAEDIKRKQSKYDALHADEKREKQSVYNNLNRAVICEKQRKRRTKANDQLTKEDRFKAFKNEFKDGVAYVCVSCHRCLWKWQVEVLFEKQIKKLVQKCGQSFFENEILMGKQTVEELEHGVFCTNCVRYVRNKKVPKIHVSNDLELDEYFEELDLTDVEEQLIAMDLIFMKIKELPTRRCNAIVDKCVNVPLNPEDIKKTVESLPRPPDEAGLVAVQFKRKKDMKNTHFEAFVRPNKCIGAIKKLKELGNPFYQDVPLDENFMLEKMEISEADQESDIESESSEVVSVIEELRNDNGKSESEDSEEEDEDDKLYAVRKYQSKQNSNTCMMPINPENMVFVNETDKPIEKKLKENSKNGTIVAPGEGKLTSRFLQRENIDVRAHPTKHPRGRNGLDHKRKFKLSPQQYFAQRLLNWDSRFAECIPYLFMSQQYIERWALQSQINIAGRRGVQSGSGDNVEVQVKDMSSNEGIRE